MDGLYIYYVFDIHVELLKHYTIAAMTTGITSNLPFQVSDHNYNKVHSEGLSVKIENVKI